MKKHVAIHLGVISITSILLASCVDSTVSSEELEIVHKLPDYEQEANAMTDQYNLKLTEVKDIHARIQEQQTLITNLENDLISKRNERNKTRDERENIEVEKAQEYAMYNDLEKQIQEDNNKLSLLEKELETAKSNFANTQRNAIESDSLRRVPDSNGNWAYLINSPLAQRLRTDLSNATNRVSHLESEISSLKSRISFQQDERERVKEEAEAVEKAIDNELKAQQRFDEVNEQLISAQRTLDGLRLQEEQIEAEEKNLRELTEQAQKNLNSARGAASNPSVQRVLRWKRIFPFLS